MYMGSYIHTYMHIRTWLIIAGSTVNLKYSRIASMSCSDNILHDNNIRDTVVLNLHRTVGLPQDHELQVCNDYYIATLYMIHV